MKSVFTGSIFLFSLVFSAHSVAANGINEVLELTEKYLKLCQTDDINDVISNLVADGSVSTSRNQKDQVLTKMIGEWEFKVMPTWGFLLQQQTAGIKNPFLCRISATVKSGKLPDFSYLEKDFLPLMTKHFGQATRIEPLPNTSIVHSVQWCQTAKGGMSLRAVNPKVKSWNTNNEVDVINAFTIQLQLFSGRSQTGGAEILCS